MTILKLIVAEYSVKQNAFHVHNVEEMVKSNFVTAVQKRGSDYIPIGIFETEEQAHDFIEKVRPEIQK